MPVEPTELETKRLLLRPFRGQDVDDVLAYSNNEEWARFLPHIPQPYTRSHAEQFVAQAVLRRSRASPRHAVSERNVCSPVRESLMQDEHEALTAD